ncbi:M61 family peptidase [Segetibacter sp. 3557_3]|uniref:M61 family metallopeptidase n=1 Tax=Segetibacter sp. 3557_3 TaxID=2547429 RepID=UPI001058F7CA|nr:PDZ domain-containing protein [Segetibacter sp. 3557_3]TDH29043.1 M61 family peptidase [Segetibacter sp. 3557_3]
MKSLLLLFSFSTLMVNGFAQSIRYRFDAPNAAHHEAEISLTVDKLPAGPALFRMSRSSPGRYATHEFGKNVYNVKAYDAAGAPLKVEKADADVYRVPTHKGSVRVTYTLYGNYADGTYTAIDAAGYHLNMPATFMWVKGLDKAPIEVEFVNPANWKIATQLKPGNKANVFTAPGLQYFMDSPVKIGDLKINAWTIANPDKKEYQIRLALEADGRPSLIDSFAKKVEKVVLEAQAVFGEVPAYDYGTYTFLASINPYVKSDGMEHRNSTMITSPRNFTGSDGSLGVFSHEFFHCWNVERIRPYQLEPFNFEKSNMSEGLWVAEGFTQYYGELILKRAGFVTEQDFIDNISGLINTKSNRPGGTDYSPNENSERAVFVDAGVSIDRTNYQNMFASYYTLGGAIALALDLDLRGRFPGTTLDHFMRELWKRFGKTEKPYTMPALEEALAAITNKAYAAGFFSRYVYGHEPFDYNTALAPAGFTLRAAGKGKAWAGPGSFTAGRNNEVVLASNTIKGTPWYNAGLDIDDVLVSINGTAITQTGEVDKIISAGKPGDKLAVVFRHRDKTITSQLELSENNFVQVVATDGAGTEKTAAFKTAWLETKAKQ